MEVTSVPSSVPVAEASPPRDADATRGVRVSGPEGGNDVEISSEARERAAARAAARESVRESRAEQHDRQEQAAREQARIESPHSTLVVRFGPAPVQFDPSGPSNADAVVRQGLAGRSLLPRVGDLLQSGDAAASATPSSDAAAAAVPLPGGGGDEEAVEVPLMGDGRDGDRAREAVELQRPAPARPRETRPLPELELLGAGRADLTRETRSEASGANRERGERDNLRRAESAPDLQAVTATAPIAGAAHAARSEQTSRNDVAAADASRVLSDADLDRLERQTMTLHGIVDADHQDQIVSRFLGRSSGEEPGPEPRPRQVLGERP